MTLQYREIYLSPATGSPRRSSEIIFDSAEAEREGRRSVGSRRFSARPPGRCGCRQMAVVFQPGGRQGHAHDRRRSSVDRSRSSRCCRGDLLSKHDIVMRAKAQNESRSGKPCSSRPRSRSIGNADCVVMQWYTKWRGLRVQQAAVHRYSDQRTIRTRRRLRPQARRDTYR